MLPDGNRACAPQLAPASVVAEMTPYRDALIRTESSRACVGEGVADDEVACAVVGATVGITVDAVVGWGVVIRASIAWCNSTQFAAIRRWTSAGCIPPAQL